MFKKKKQTIGYRYRASAHAVLCHGPVDSITKISFQDKDAYLNEESENKTIFVDKPALFGGDEQAGGVQGGIELHFGAHDQPKSTKLQEICSSISDAFGGLISAYRGVVSVVFDSFYYGTSPQFPESTWRVKRIHTRHDGIKQWYDEKAEISAYQITGDNWEYVQLPYHSNPGYENLVPPSSGWVKSSYLPFDDSNGWTRNPNLSVFWVKKKITLIGGEGIVLKVGADNGCLLWVDGVYIGASNRDNLDVAGNQQFPVEFSVEQSGAFEVLVKAFTESTISSQGGNYLNITIDGIKAGDINPAHIIRECLTNSVWGIGVAEADIDDASFKKAADTLYAEKMGISIKWDDSTSIEEFIDIIKKHINAELYFDKSDAKWKLYLIRADYNVDDLDHLNESHVRNLEFERRTLAECINTVALTYWDRERSKDSSVPADDIARIAQQGGVVFKNIEYRGFTNSDIASRVAYRELQTLSANLASVSFDVSENHVQGWHLGMPFKLSDDSHGLAGAIFRVKEMRLGDGINNTVVIDAVEDSFSSPMQAVVEYVPPIKTNFDAKDATAIAFEVPYIELVEQYGQDEIDAKLEKNPDLSFVGMAAIRPNNSHINAALFSDAGAGYGEVSTLDFCPVAELKTAISYTDSLLQLQNIREFNQVKASNRLQIGSELMSVVSFDAETKTLTVKRGVFDTVPAQHLVGSTLYVWDNYSGLDGTEYLSCEAVSLKALTQTNADQLSIAEATAHEITCSARAIRPYPPANVKINGEYYPAEIETDLVLTWADRNRLQQTGGEPLGFFEGGITAETGALYQLVLIERDENNIEVRTQNLSIGAVNTYTFAITAMHVNTRTIQIVLRSLRDSYESYQAFDYTVELSQFFSAPYDLTVEFKND